MGKAEKMIIMLLIVGIILFGLAVFDLAKNSHKQKPQQSTISVEMYEKAQKRIMELERELGVANYKLRECALTVVEPKPYRSN